MKFIKENVNPKGWKTNDCVIRAIAKATDQTWEDVFSSLSAIALKKCRMPNDPKVYEEYLKNNGWVKMKQPRKANGKKFTVKEFLDNEGYLFMYDKGKIFSVANHLTYAFWDCLYDTWDCSRKCVGNYWVKG